MNAIDVIVNRSKELKEETEKFACACALDCRNIRRNRRKYIYSSHASNIKNIIDKYEKSCNHDLVIKCHESVVVGPLDKVPAKHDLSLYGIEERYQPNPNHVRYYCVGCGKMLDEKEIENAADLPWNYVIDLFGHPDSLSVGHFHFKAAIDYIVSEIQRLSFYDIKSDTNEIIKYIEDDFDGKRIPRKYVRTKSR